MLHYFAIALIVVGVGCFMFVPVLGASLFIAGIIIETVGYPGLGRSRLLAWPTR